MNKRILPGLLATVLILASCVTNTNTGLDEKETNLLVEGVSSDFNWSTIRPVDLMVDVDDQYAGAYYYSVETWSDNPINNENAKLLAKGFANQNNLFETSLSVPSNLSSLFIRQTSPTGKQAVKVVAIQAQTTCDFGSQPAAQVGTRSASAPQLRMFDPFHEDSYPTVVPNDAAAYTSDMWVSSGVFYLPDGFSGSINAGGGTFYVAGDAQVNLSYIGPNGVFYVLPNASLTFTNDYKFNQSGNAVYIAPSGTLNVQSLQIGNSAVIYNKGNINASTAIQLAVNGSLYNQGNISVNELFSLQNDQAYFYNEGTLTAHNFAQQGSADMTNMGTMTILNASIINSTHAVWQNYGTYTTRTMSMTASNYGNSYNACKLIVENDFLLSSHGLQMGEGSYAYTKHLEITNAIVEMESNSIFEVENTADYGWNPQASGYGFYGTGSTPALLRVKIAQKKNKTNDVMHYGGNLHIENKKHFDLQKDPWNIHYTIDPSVTMYDQGESPLIIPSSECSAGNNVPSTDPEDPTDPEEPEEPEEPTSPTGPVLVNPGISYTYAFEDMWPMYGDYDVNDLVVTLTPGYYINTDNKITQWFASATIKAIGASKTISAAIQLDNILVNQVGAVRYQDNDGALNGSVFMLNSVGVETDQDKAVIPLFDNAHSFMGASAQSMINTIIGGARLAPKTFGIEVDFTGSNVTLADIDPSKLNFFLVTNGVATQRQEVHLRGYQPTNKVNTNLLNTAMDQFSIVPFSSKDNLVWGLMLPVDFQYPKEFTNVREAYPGFTEWAKSSGSTNTDWYNTPETDKIYTFSEN